MTDGDGLGVGAEVREQFVEPSGEAFRRLVEVMARLRTDCPWDREQTHLTLARHLLEETYETLEAIDSGDLDALREELGDLVIQVVFHSNIAFEEGAFTIADVLDQLREKLVRRHPHVFGDVEVSGAEEVKSNWEQIKQQEKSRRTLDGIPAALPALARASKLHRRARQVGFRWPDVDGYAAKVDEEVEELRSELRASVPDRDRIEAEIGDLLFAAVELAQQYDIEPEDALRRTLQRFEGRFRSVEDRAAEDGRLLESLSVDEWERYWEQAKREHT